MNNLGFLDVVKGKKILIAPLDWGLGHATRSSCVIEKLKSANEVDIASSGLALTWLKRSYPDLCFHQLPSYNVKYRNNKMWLNIMSSLPQILKSIRAENRIVNELVKEHKYDLIIADHRFGTYNDNCRSVVIAHQINIPHSNPLFASLASFLNHRLLNKYDEVWIPDYKDPEKSISGVLSNASKLKCAKHIGPLSMIDDASSQLEKDIDVAVILSGPEPSRTHLESKLLEKLNAFKGKNLRLIRGSNLMRSSELQQSNVFCNIIDLADHKTVADIISRSHLIICRSGYSSIMDLEALDRKAILIPTKNQPEQEYLAIYHSARGYIRLDEEEIDRDLFSILNMVE